MAVNQKFMGLPAVITTIRQRTGDTKTDFARRLQVTQPSITRYESGEVTPGHYPLLMLFSLAKRHERPLIAEALRDVLGLATTPTEKVIQEGLQIAEEAFGELVKIAARTPVDTRAHRFVTEALRIANKASGSPDDYPPESAIEFLSLLWKHANDLEALGLFEDAVGCLKVHLTKMH